MIIRGFIALALTSCATDWLPHPAAASDVPAASPRLPLTVPVQAVDAVISGTPGRPELGGGLTLDRPLYRPGETVWTRVWDLGPDFAPGDAQDVSLSLVNVQDRTVAEALLAGVAGGASTGLQLPSSAPGGLYRVRARLGERMLERPFVVQSFVQPRIRKELQLLRDAYGPGDEVVAALSVKSAGAGPLADHAVRVLVQVEGRVAQTLEARTDSEGEATVRFDLPDDMVLPDASVTVLVEEEGWSESVHREVPVVLDGVRIDWFPEGGQLVAGLPGRVYLRATDAHGEPADVAGEVLDDRGRVVSRFASVHDGLGRTAFTPQRGRRYHARLTQPSSDEQQHALPAVEDVGCVLTSYDDPDQQRAELRVGVWCDSARTVVVAGDLSGRSFAPAQVRAGPRAPAVVHLALAEPGPQRQGVAQVTVLSEELRPLAERLVYRNLHRGLSIDVQLPDDGARPGEEVSLTVTTTDPQGRPVPADLAMSVVDDRLLQHADDEHGHLLSQLYLGSWISEQIDDPAWYFDPDEADAALGLDLVLGTVGWRGFRSLENGAGEGTAAVAPDPVPERDVADAETVMLSGVLGHVDGAGGLGLHGAGLGGGGRADGLSGLVGVDNLVAGSEIVGLGDLGKGIGSGRSGYGTGGGNFGARGSGGVARAAEPVVMGSLDKNVIRAVVKQHLNQIRYCYLRELNRRPDLRGKLTMRFMIGADGYVRQATVKTTSIQNDAVGDCVRGRLLRMRFPERPGGEMVMVSYPFLFSPDGSSDWGPSYDVVRTFPRGMLRTSNGVRHDFRSTVHFDPRITTGADGTAEVNFVVSDAVTTFRISAEGVGGGHAGRVEEELHSTRPFALDVVLPTEVSFGDRVLMPVRLRNRTDDRLQVVLDTDLEAPLVAEDGTGNQSFGMPRADGRTTYVPVSVPDVAGEATVRVAAAADGLQDEVVHTVRVAPRGFPHRVTEAGELQRVARHTITIDDALPGSIDARLSLYPNPLSTLMDGMESMVGWPGGCFEQTSSTNYPNVLILRHLERTDRHGALQMDRTEVLRSGYERLVGYQVDSGGFETFGRGPGKEALSAYGLLQFADMRTVFSEVSPAMVERDVRYLLGARDGSGGYRASGASSHQWGAAPASLTNAFITWALLETGHLTDGTEVGLARQRAETESDPYALSLSVLALQHADPAAAEVAAGRLAAMQHADGSFVGAATSVVGSGGRDLLVETTALAVLALNRATGEAAGVRRGASWLASARRGHGWGATQATVLALKALDAVASQSADPHAGWVQVRVDGKAVGTLQWTGTETSGVQLDLASVLPAGTHEVELVAEVPLHEPVPYSLDATWRRDTPLDAPEAPLTLTTEWSATEVSLGSPVRLVARVQNVSDAEVASPIARIGLPAGVRAETRQLEALRAEGTIAFFETRPREVILYWEGFAPDQQTTVRLDLVSEVPGRFAAPPSVVHPYYDSDAKRWTAGAKLTIRPG